MTGLNALIGFNFDPVEFVTQIVVIFLLVLVLIFVWRHWSRVLMVLTPGGDDRIHCTCIDFIWHGVFHCCGACTGDWTRSLTTWWCCPRGMRGQNLLTLFGQSTGFSTISVELKNIVVGDLPFDGRADFFITVEVQSNPPMATSVAEDRNAKAVHFPEIFTLRLCRNPLEDPLTIRVFQLHPIIGQVELCFCRISALQVLNWSESYREDKSMRFEMRNAVDGHTCETPPWILLDFEQPQEARQLDYVPPVDVVRTTTLTGDVMNTSIADYKHQYCLLDPNGQPTQEPLEEDLQEIEWIEWVMSSIQGLIMFCTTWASLAYLSIRGYAWSCYRQYTDVAMADLNGLEFPVPTAEMKQLLHSCRAQVQGTGERGVPCRPDREQVMEYCLWPEDGGHKFPARERRPAAFTKLARELFGVQLQGITCGNGVCELRDKMVDYDHFIIVALVVPVVLHFILRWASQKIVNHTKRRQKAEATRATQAMRQARWQRTHGLNEWQRQRGLVSMAQEESLRYP